MNNQKHFRSTKSGEKIWVTPSDGISKPFERSVQTCTSCGLSGHNKANPRCPEKIRINRAAQQQSSDFSCNITRTPSFPATENSQFAAINIGSMGISIPIFEEAVQMGEGSAIGIFSDATKFSTGPDRDSNLAEASSQMVVVKDSEDSAISVAVEDSDSDYEPEVEDEVSEGISQNRSSVRLAERRVSNISNSQTDFSATARTSYHQLPVEGAPDPEELIAMDVAQRDQQMEIEGTGCAQTAKSAGQRRKSKKASQRLLQESVVAVEHSGEQSGKYQQEGLSSSAGQCEKRLQQQQRSAVEEDQREQGRRLREQEELLRQWQREEAERQQLRVQPVGRAGPYAVPNPAAMFQALEDTTLRDYRQSQPKADYLPVPWHSVTKLDSLEWDQMSSILSLGRPMDFLPANLIMKVRRVFNYCFQILFAEPDSEIHWKRLLLLPTILFIETGDRRRADLSTKCDLILANKWPFTVGDYAGRMKKPDDDRKTNRNQLPVHSSPVESVAAITTVKSFREEKADEKRLAYAQKLIQRGEVAKAYRVVVSDTSVQHYSAEGLAFLEDKHPAPRNGGAPTWQPSADVVHVSAEPISSDAVRVLVRSASRGAASRWMYSNSWARRSQKWNSL